MNDRQALELIESQKGKCYGLSCDGDYGGNKGLQCPMFDYCYNYRAILFEARVKLGSVTKDKA